MPSNNPRSSTRWRHASAARSSRPLDVQARLTNVLPERVTAIAGPVTLALQDGLTRRLETLLAEPRMQQALTRTLAFAHTRVMNLLRDQADAATVVNGEVVLEVYPALLVALQELQTAGIIGPEVELPDPATAEPPGVVRGILENRLGVTLPEDFGTIPLMPAERLETAQTAVRVFDLVVIVLIVLAVALVALAIWLSGKRLRMVVFLAIGTIVAFVLARLFTNAAADALTAGIAAARAARRDRVDPRRHPGRLPQLGVAHPHRHRDHRDPGLPVQPAERLGGVVQHGAVDGTDRARRDRAGRAVDRGRAGGGAARGAC